MASLARHAIKMDVVCQLLGFASGLSDWDISWKLQMPEYEGL